MTKKVHVSQQKASCLCKSTAILMFCSCKLAIHSSSCPAADCAQAKMVQIDRDRHPLSQCSFAFTEISGLKRKLTNNLSPSNAALGPQWEVGECVGIYWRPNFETILYPYLPPHVTRPKECKKLFLAPLPEKCYFSVIHSDVWAMFEVRVVFRCRRICVCWQCPCLSSMIMSRDMDPLSQPSLRCCHDFG